MPDFINQSFFHCETAEYFAIEVQGKTGNYVVKWDNHSHLNKRDVQYDYSCSCWAYLKGKGKYCKHISKVKESEQHCKWLQFIDGGEPIVIDGEKHCPKCNKSVRSMLWAV